MSQVRTSSSPDLKSSIAPHQYDDSALEGVAPNTKLLLKLIQDHREACSKEENGSRRKLRVATMMAVLDNIGDRIRKCQSFGNKASGPDLRRCNTMISRPAPDPTHKPNTADDEKGRLRRELASSLAAQKSLQAMCSSLGKEKEIMAAELSRKVHELTGMEELIGDLRAQNETLLERVKRLSSDHEERKSRGGAGEPQAAEVLQDRNRALSEHLQQLLDGHKSMKRKLKAAHDENVGLRATLDEMSHEKISSLDRIRGFKDRVEAGESDLPVDVRAEILALEGMFECFQMVVEKHGKKQGEWVQLTGAISAGRTSIVA